MQAEDIRVGCADDFELAASVYRPAAHERQGAVVVCSALGVPRRFYGRFAAYLASRGFQALVFDYRGIGDSLSTTRRASAMRLREWGMLDIDAVLRRAREEVGGEPLFLVGHSCGGQLPGLAPASEHLSGMVFVAAQMAHWRLWPFPLNLAMWELWTTLVPLLTVGREYFPARRLKQSSIDWPAGVTREWAKWARSRDYLFTPGHGLDTSRYGRLAVPILAYGFDDDRYAPAKAIDALLRRHPACAAVRRQVRPKDVGAQRIGHFGFFREAMRDTLWRDTADWMRDVAQSAPPPRSGAMS